MTISGGAPRRETDVVGMRMSWSGRAKRASTEAAWEERGVRARFLVARWERGSAEVGMDSGPGADMVVVGDGGGDEEFEWCGVVTVEVWWWWGRSKAV